MHASPHPSQVRSACERCRQLKLRCLRQTPTDASCTRCTRLSLHCQAGSQRKVGRPPKREVVKRRQYEQPETPGGDAEDDMCSPDFQFFDDLGGNDAVKRGWPTPGISTFEFDSFDKMALSSDYHILMQRLQSPPPRDQALIAMPSGSHTDASSDVHFEALSKINVKLHGLCNSITRHAQGMDFGAFVCFAVEDFQGMMAFQIIMQTAQEYLVTIKALHRMIGTKTTPAETPSTDPMEKACTTPFRAPNALFDNVVPNLSEPPRPEADPGQPPPATRTLDSPIAFLVISCFVQLIRPMEFVITIMHAHITDTTLENHPPAEGMSFADVPIVDFSTQALLAIELMSHTLDQIQLVLGLPSPWSGKSIWTGLLSTQKYRDMLNTELGAVEGAWTTRPAMLMERISSTKHTLLEYSMAGDW